MDKLLTVMQIAFSSTVVRALEFLASMVLTKKKCLRRCRTTMRTKSAKNEKNCCETKIATVFYGRIARNISHRI